MEEGRSMIVIACKYDSERPVVKRAVETARKFLPNERVWVIDSNSTDKSYFDEIEKLGAEIHDIKNLHYDTGAYWYAYKNNPNEEFFFLIHDSCYFVKSPPEDIYDAPVTAFMTLDNPGPSWAYAIGPEITWSKEQLELTEIQFKAKNFQMVGGPVLFVQSHILGVLREKKFDLILPTNKVPGVGATERLWGIALQQIGIDVIPSLVPWELDHKKFSYSTNPDGYRGEWFAKSWLFRDHPV